MRNLFAVTSHLAWAFLIGRVSGSSSASTLTLSRTLNSKLFNVCVRLSEASVRSLAAVPAETGGSPPSFFRSSPDPRNQTPRSAPPSSWISNRPPVLSQRRLTRLSPPSHSGPHHPFNSSTHHCSIPPSPPSPLHSTPLHPLFPTPTGTRRSS